MMTATELFKRSSYALAITGPAEWDSPDSPGQHDALLYVDDEAAEDGPLWCLAPTGSADDDYLPMDTVMAQELIESHLRAWLLRRGWQVQATIRKQAPRWRRRAITGGNCSQARRSRPERSVWPQLITPGARRIRASAQLRLASDGVGLL